MTPVIYVRAAVPPEASPLQRTAPLFLHGSAVHRWHHHAGRRDLDQGLEVNTRAGDRRGRLGGEQCRHRRVLVGERATIPLFREKEGADGGGATRPRTSPSGQRVVGQRPNPGRGDAEAVVGQGYWRWRVVALRRGAPSTHWARRRNGPWSGRAHPGERVGQGGIDSSRGPAMRYPTPRSLKIQVGRAASSPSFRRRLRTKMRTRLASALLRPRQTRRSSVS